jgi:hypothetical protein
MFRVQEMLPMLRTLVIASALVTFAAPAIAQPPAGQGQGQGQGRGQGRGPRGPQPLPFENHDGYTQIFDGASLKGWDGDPAFWKAEGGAIVGQSTAENKVTQNTFLIWRGGEPGDFDLKLEFRINATNSGIQVRSVQVPEGTQTGAGARAGKWVMKGYQADIDFNNQYTGQIYEERGRMFLAMRGQFSYITADGKPQVIGALETSADQLKALVKQNDWNQVHIIARGNMITEIVNGHVTSVVVDDDEKGRMLKGLIGFQIHVGDPMKVEFRNIWLKQ